MFKNIILFNLKYLLSILLALLLLSCENGQNVTVPIDVDDNITAEEMLDTNIVVPVELDRIGWQKPNEVIKMLGDLRGESVADIGAGIGFFAFRFAFKADKVIALDINPYWINVMDTIALGLPKDIQEKFEARIAAEDDANLDEDEVDNIVIINTIAFINNKKKYLEGLKKGLKKGGKLMIMDFKMKRLAAVTAAPDLSGRIPHYQIEDLMEDAGYSIIKSDDTTLDSQYVVIGQYD